jgi:hypothetical protein
MGLGIFRAVAGEALHRFLLLARVLHPYPGRLAFRRQSRFRNAREGT